MCNSGNRYKQKKQIIDDIKFNMKVEIEIDVYSDVKQAEK